MDLRWVWLQSRQDVSTQLRCFCFPRYQPLLRWHPRHDRIHSRTLLENLLEVRGAPLPPTHHCQRTLGLRAPYLRRLRLPRLGQHHRLDNSGQLSYNDPPCGHLQATQRSRISVPPTHRFNNTVAWSTRLVSQRAQQQGILPSPTATVRTRSGRSLKPVWWLPFQHLLRLISLNVNIKCRPSFSKWILWILNSLLICKSGKTSFN